MEMKKKAVANILYLNNNSLGQFFDSVIWYYYVDDLYIKAQAYIVCIHKYYMTLFMCIFKILYRGSHIEFHKSKPALLWPDTIFPFQLNISISLLSGTQFFSFIPNIRYTVPNNSKNIKVYSNVLNIHNLEYLLLTQSVDSYQHQQLLFVYNAADRDVKCLSFLIPYLKSKYQHVNYYTSKYILD